MECTNNCSTCTSTCGHSCPVCGGSAMGVETATVINLSKITSLDIEKQFYICLNPKCKVIYFNENNSNVIEYQDVKVPVWFKSNFMNYVVCYCRNIYLRDVIKAVLSLEEPSKENIIKFLNKENIETNCLINNPISRDCDILFKNAIEYALDLKKKQEGK